MPLDYSLNKPANEPEKKFSPHMERFLGSYQEAVRASVEEPAAKIQVNLVIGALSFVYEKFRNLIDYKDEHLLRKNAIQRILTRRVLPGIEPSDVARPLTEELVRSGYLKNNTVPETKLLHVEQILGKYFYFLEKVSKLSPETYNQSNVNWLWSAAAAEIEESFFPKATDRALLDLMLQTVKNKVQFVDLKVGEEEKNLLLFIANLKSLWRADIGIIRYEILRKLWPNWRAPSQDELDQYAGDFEKTIQQIDKLITKPVGEKLLRLFQRYTVFFDILRDALLKKPELARTKFYPYEDFWAKVEKACENRYHESRNKLRRSMVRSVIYIFITKIFLAILIEVPFDLFVAEEFRYLPIGLNVLVPPLLMFILGASVRVPSKKNTQKIIQGLDEILFKSPEEQEKILMQTVVRRSKTTTTIFNAVYAIIFTGIIGGIIYVLHRLNFNIVSGAIFIIFLSMISFFGFRIRRGAHELVVIKSNGNLFTLLFELLFLPVVRLGRWISLKSSKINFFIFVFDVIIEAPFKALVEALEDLLNFFKEKKEEVY
ncbi:hypothetical protein KJ969_00335 [Patescibacteria group bacterium]|nr:hypothetical protein [Patescibacteria group bacterium]MBU1922531.1 hypothetical protein [Patescibacteria group bacterium]